MDVRKLLVAVAVGGAVVLPSEAHRGPEQHPTVQEFEEVVSELSIASDDMERRLSERLDGVEARRVGEPDQQGIADAVEGAVGLAGAELVQSSNELTRRAGLGQYDRRNRRGADRGVGRTISVARISGECGEEVAVGICTASRRVRRGQNETDRRGSARGRKGRGAKRRKARGHADPERAHQTEHKGTA